MKRREGQAMREQETGLRVERQAWSSLPSDKARRCGSLQGRAIAGEGTRLPGCSRTVEDRREGRMETPGEPELVA